MSQIGLPRKIRDKLSMWYLQSESERPELSQFLYTAIENINDIPTSDNVSLSKSAVIKAARESEKGIILVGFEHELDRLISSSNFSWITANYDILFMPTWQPFYSEALLRALKKAKDSLVLLPSSEGCYYRALALPEHFRALPFHASSWINHELYPQRAKDIDILMVANFATYKRHILLFEALKDLPSNLNVVLVGRPLSDRKASDLIAEARKFGVEDRFRLFESPSDDDVVDYLCRAKLVLGLSGREGSYVSLAEALFADAAVAVYANAYIGTKAYINPRTGFLLQTDISLATQIKQCLKHVEDLSPREWAISNISAHENITRLNKLLHAAAIKSGRTWTQDCDQFHIRSFQVYPEKENWSPDIQQQVKDLAKQGVHFRTQLKAIEIDKNISPFDYPPHTHSRNLDVSELATSTKVRLENKSQPTVQVDQQEGCNDG